MAAVTLEGNTFPVVYTKAGVTTALQAFTLPAGTRQVAVSGSAAVQVQFTGTDAGVKSATAYWPIAAGGTASWSLSPGSAATVLVAAVTGTSDVSVSCEGAL